MQHSPTDLQQISGHVFQQRDLSFPAKKIECFLALCLAILVCSGPKLHAQATRSAGYRLADLQIGAGFAGADPDYSPETFYGYFGYATFDFTHHYGVDFTVRQLNTTATNKLYERTYELSGRYVRHYDELIPALPFAPYLKAGVGRGVFNFPYDSANLAYNMFQAGGGVDVSVTKAINVRLDYEYQRWASFPPRGLQPNVLSVGVAYHFH